MNSRPFRSAFVVFHLILGSVIVLQSIGVVLRAHSESVVVAMSSHLSVLAIAEALSALLFLIPKTVLVGGSILLVIFGIVIFVHGIRTELALLIYAAGVVLVMIQGGSYKIG